MAIFVGKAQQQLLMFIYLCCAIFAQFTFKGSSMPFLGKLDSQQI